MKKDTNYKKYITPSKSLVVLFFQGRYQWFKSFLFTIIGDKK